MRQVQVKWGSLQDCEVLEGAVLLMLSTISGYRDSSLIVPLEYLTD
jgi:hypothetical protein